jgi:hypothetical protein
MGPAHTPALTSVWTWHRSRFKGMVRCEFPLIGTS